MTAGIVATALVAWPAAPFFLFMHGKDITLPKGTEFPVSYERKPSPGPLKFQPPAPPTQPQVIAPTPDATPAQVNPSADVDFTSSPTGAEIQIDGKFVGNTPSTISVPTGDHVISIKKAGYKLWERKITISTGKVAIAAELEADGDYRPI